MIPEIQPTPLVFPYILSAVLTLGLTAYAAVRVRKTGRDETAIAFIAIVLGVSLWSVSRAFEFLFVSQTLTRFWIAVLYVGYGMATLSAVFFAFAFTGRTQYLTRKLVVLVFTLPAVAVAVAATNAYHELFWTGEFVYDEAWGDILVFDRDFQPLFFAYLAYTVGGTLFGLILLLRMAVGSPDVYRRQTVAFAVGAIVALTFGLLFVLEAQPFVPPYVDLTPVGFAITGLCFGYAIFRHRMLDLVPVARNTVIENMRDGYVVLDADGRIVDLNDAAMELLAIEGDVVGSDVFDLHPDLQPNLADVGDGSETELTVEDSPETRFIVVNVSELTEGEAGIGTLLLIRDVTERRSVQRRFQALIENSTDVILVVDPDGTITYASPSTHHVLGVDPSSIERENVTDYLHEDDREWFYDTVDTLVETPGEQLRREIRTRDASGNELFLEASIWNLIENPFVEGIVVNAREITQRKRHEQELEETNEQLTRANEQLEQFAGVISHDLRNPINVAQGHLQLATETDGEEHFETIDRSLDRMEAIIEDVLTLAREGKTIGDTDEVDLLGCAQRAWKHVSTDEATLEVAENGTFEADEDRLLQLFENLFRNAHEHVGEDVTVTVGLENGALYVADDGPGIPEEKREQVLEPGHTTNRGGTGLGLSIVSQIAEAHGWNVTVTASDDGGARFEFRGLTPAAD